LLESTAALHVDPATLALRLAEEKRRIITASNTGELAPRVALIVIFALIAASGGHRWGAAIWAVAMILLPGPALFWPDWFFSLPDKYFWPACTFIGGVAGPIGWCALLLLVPASNFNLQLILLFLVCVAVVVRARVTAYSPPEMYLQILVSCGGLAAIELIEGGPYRWPLAASLAVFSVGLLGYGRSAYTQFVRLVEFNLQNAALVEQLKQANSAKTRFLASASHDLRQPLHSAGLLVGMLETRIADAEGRAIVGRLVRAVGAMESLLNAILSISRLDAGVERPHIAALSVDALFDRLERSFGAEAVRRQLALRFHGRQRWVASDEHLLTRILNNLVSNSLRYTHQGGVLIAAREHADFVSLEVWDTGIGIPSDRQAEIFEEFVQLQNLHRDRSQGLGLGLAIVKRTAAVLEHPLELKSRANRGTVVRLRLPRVDVPRILESAAPEQVLSDLTGLYVVLVDDEQDVRYAMQGLLSDWGCTVVAASSPAEALAEVGTRLRKPDVMVIDYRLPGENGVELAAKLQTLAGLTIPTLIVTGDVAISPLRDIERSGLPVLHKPVNPSKLRQWLAAVKASLDAAPVVVDETSKS